ncbi:MAG TPA: carbon monoxide dehydrogenase subunit G [Promineifilum sp.]|nr:carbon monoxide dehydrogenase subunit G [Promineifilum sp.]
MDMSGNIELQVPRPVVWRALNDPTVLKVCIPGCEELERIGDGGLAAVAVLKVGPIKAKFKGSVKFFDVIPEQSYTIMGEGQGGIAGFASGAAKVQIEETSPNCTTLSYQTEAKVGGKLAQLGARLIDSTAKKLAAEFFEKFRAEVERINVNDASA